jgi:hypothetical protein
MKQLLEALDLALEALERMNHADSIFAGEFDKEITAIKQARSAPVQEPHKGLSEHMMQATNGRVRIDPVTGNAGIGTPLVAQPDMAWIERERAVGYREGHMAALAQRQWVSLTADERYDIRASFRGRFLETSEFAEQVQLATEAKLKEKNNG